MITIASGSIFDSKADALVNPVNCYGVSGAGLAKEFAGRFPDEQRLYKRWCKQGHARLGEVLYVSGVPGVYYFPTKGHWRDQSRLADIETGLVHMREQVVKNQHGSIAVPALGCGLGGLRWKDVLSLFRANLDGLTADVLIYEPK